MTTGSSKAPVWWVALLPAGVRSRLMAYPGFAKVVENLGWLVVDKVLRLVVGVMVSVWVARYLGPGRFGDLSFALAIVGVVGTAAGLGLNGVVVRDLVRDPPATSGIVAASFLLQLLGSVAAIAVLSLLAVMYRPGGSEASWLMQILAFTLLFKVSDVTKYWLEATVQSRYAVWVENSALVLGAGVRVALVLTGASVISFAWAQLLEVAVASLGLLVCLRLLGVRWMMAEVTAQRAIALLKDAWPLLFAGLAVMLYMRLDMLMLRHMEGSAAVGLYAAATRISEIFYMIPTVIVSSISPAIIRRYSDDKGAYGERMADLYCVLAWVAVGCAVPVVLSAGWLAKFLFGAEYAGASAVLSIHMWGSIPVFLGVASSLHLLADGRQVLSFLRTLLGLAINVVLNLVLIPRMGAAGAALATVISYFVATYSLVLISSTRAHALSMMMAPFTIPIRRFRRA